MVTLKIENKEVENIFLDGFASNKEASLNFIKDSYDKMTLLSSSSFRSLMPRQKMHWSLMNEDYPILLCFLG